MIALLHSRRWGATSQELAIAIGVSRRTIQRYVHAFELAGVPLIRDEETGAWSIFRSEAL